MKLGAVFSEVNRPHRTVEEGVGNPKPLPRVNQLKEAFPLSVFSWESSYIQEDYDVMRDIYLRGSIEMTL